MKWFALAGALLAAVVTFLVLRGSPPQLAVQSAAVAPLVPAASPLPTSSKAMFAPRRRWLMAGAMVDARDPSRSQALIGVDGAAPRLLRSGEAIDAQWRLSSIRSDSATVVHSGGELVEIPLTEGTSSASPTVTAAASAALPDKPLPGFTPGRMPSAVLAPGAATERNRRFVQDRQNAASTANR